MNKLLTVIVAVAALIAGIFIFSILSKPMLPEHALYYQHPRMIKPFNLIDHQGKEFGNQQLLGKWSWVFLGYTSCPDVCPTTLQELNFIYPELKEIADNTQVLLVTVDPQRDNQQKLAQYIAYFHPEFIALRAEHDVLYPFARNLGLMYALTDSSAGESYLVDHSASIVLINPEGQIAAIFKPKHELGQVPTVDGANMVKDFAKIVALSN